MRCYSILENASELVKMFCRHRTGKKQGGLKFVKGKKKLCKFIAIHSS